MRLKDKVAIITGGSRGIGYATARRFLQEGAAVILAGSTPQSAHRAVRQLRQEFPAGTVAGISPDLTRLDAVQQAFAQVARQYGCVDILVNNAGVTDSTPFAGYTQAGFDRVLDVNLRGVFHASRAAADCMLPRGRGVILSTSSVVGRYGQPTGVAYPATKFAVNGLTLSLARELGPQGIRVNAVAPGITETDMLRSVPPEVLQPLVADIPLRRLAWPEDVANAFVFLASDEAAYITGVVLPVDGMARV